MIIKTFEQYNRSESILNDFLQNSNGLINEKDKSSIKDIVKTIISDLKINLGFVGTFGFAISGLYPIVESLIDNMNISSTDITPRVIVMLVLAALSIIFLEEKNSKAGKEEDLRSGAKSLLTELKLSGIGNGIVKKLVESLKSIKNIVNIIIKHSGKSVEGMSDMFAYTSLLVPILNGINHIIGEYDLNIDSLLYNLASIATGILTIVAKNGIKEILKRMGLNKDQKKKIISDIEVNDLDDVDEEIPNIVDGRPNH